MTTRGRDGRCLGLIGGLGPLATVHYYRKLVAAHEAEGYVPRMLIAHADVNRARGLVAAGDLAGLAGYLARLVEDTAAGGAELTAIVAITPHICIDQLVPLSPLPVIDMVATVADTVRARSLSRVALLGTRFTLETRMFGRLGGVEVVMPRPDEIERIDKAYFDIVLERSTTAQVDDLRRLAHTFMTRDGAEAILLAGTDLSAAFDESNTDFPAIDCAGIHIEAIMRRLLAGA